MSSEVLATSLVNAGCRNLRLHLSNGLNMRVAWLFVVTSLTLSLAFFSYTATAADNAQATPDVEADRSSYQHEFTAAFEPLPPVSPDAPDWGSRFREEMPSVASPYYGVNIVDVRRENYDAIVQNIRGQVQGAEFPMGGRLHFFSATEYGEVRRIIFIIYFESFPSAESLLTNLRATGVDIPASVSDFPDIWTGTEVWTQFTRLAEGYTWWIAPMSALPEPP